VSNTEDKINKLKSELALLDSQIGLANFEIEDLQNYEGNLRIKKNKLERRLFKLMGVSFQRNIRGVVK
jgi:hypothetical protein